MEPLKKEYVKTFLEKQLQLFDENVADTEAEAREFLEDNLAVVLENLSEVRAYMEESGMDAAELSKEELEHTEEVFPLPDGKYLVVIA